jgi:hypothetical protein
MDINWQPLITGALTIFAITYFTKKATFSVQEGQLRFGLFMKSLGLVCLLFSIVPLFVLLTGSYQVNKSGETTALIGIVAGFGIGAIFILAEAFFVKGTYNDTGIVFSTPWSGTKEEKWDDLESLYFSNSIGWYVLKFKSGKVIRLSTYLGGYSYLLQFLQDRGHNLP